MLIENDKVIIFFGDSKSCTVDCKTPELHDFCDVLSKKFGLDRIVFNNQVHGAFGYLIDSPIDAKKFKNRGLAGDFLVTDQKLIGIGVLTADCLPIIFHDTKNNIVAAIHAGWRSSVQNICEKVLKNMYEKFGTTSKDLNVYFGPCAKSCCYEVGDDFCEKLKTFEHVEQAILHKNNKLFFDNVLFNTLLLNRLGISSEQINYSSCICTICNSNFYSYRRDNKVELRQISFIALKK